MANADVIDLTLFRCSLIGEQVDWEQFGQWKLQNLAQVFWNDGSPWREANLWLFERGTSRDVSIKTVLSNAIALASYATWLETSGSNWWDFPQRKSERCLVKYRGSLINDRSTGRLAPSTASSRMRIVIAFYRWLDSVGLLSSDWPMWKERTIGVALDDRFGLQRTLNVSSTDLAIPNRSRRSSHLEGGLFPVSGELRSQILDLAKRESSEELHLMLSIGFFSGLRLGSICDLKIETLERATPDASEVKMHWIAVGPSAHPPVTTKYDVLGQVVIPDVLLKKLLDYAYSVRRLTREALAKGENKSLLFLTRYGNPYVKKGGNLSSAINAEMHRLRKAGIRQKLPLNYFKFHQTRATFATSVAEIAIRVGGPINAIGLVKELLLHRDEATSLKYIRFIEKTLVKSEMANEFSRELLGCFEVRLSNGS